VTGGVHGYETSGVEGALLFLETKAEAYSKDFNILVAPCISPWGYERIHLSSCLKNDVCVISLYNNKKKSFTAWL
jgi:hypothetical protein